MNSQILYEDNHIIIINKKVGQLVQGDKTGDQSLLELLKDFIKERDQKPGNVYLGLVHRIDRPTSGLVIYAKTSKALSRLTQMVKNLLGCGSQRDDSTKPNPHALSQEKREKQQSHHLLPRDRRSKKSHS